MASSRNSESPDPLCETVATCLSRHLTPGLSLVVGFSGGRDSTALLHALHKLQSCFGYQLKACHVNHRISPYAPEWQSFCRGFCDDLGIPLDVRYVDVPRKGAEGLEAAARAERYAVFEGLSADWLALGQHRGDQAETLLFNLLRGTGMAGAAGMPETRIVREGMRLIRPLLGVSRHDIEDYLLRHALTWVEDESNADIGFSRNFMRHQVLPLLHSRFPAAERKLAAAAGRFGEARMLLDELAVLDLADAVPGFPIPIARFINLPEPRVRNMLRYLLTRHDVKIPSEDRLIEAARQLLKAMPDRHPAIVFGRWQLRRRRGEVHLEPA